MSDAHVEALVLLVEDEEPLRRGMQAWLRDNQYGYAVMTASDAQQALEMIERYHPDLVVSDIRMPGMDGLQLLLTCRRMFPKMKFMVMSAYGTPELETWSRRTGAVRFLHKPVDMENLENSIASVLGQGAEEERSGFLRGVSIPGFLQLLSVERKTVVLRLLASDGRAGSMYLSDGQLVHAEYDEFVGAGAAMELMTWEGAEMEIETIHVAPGSTINESLPTLLMEAMRQKDEAAR